MTRDPEKRWGEQEVLRWINNERDIPVHYEYSEEKTTNENIKPYRFHGSKYHSLESLVAAFIENPETWDEAVKHLGRGYILKWLEDIGEYDKAVSLEKTETSQLEWKLFDLIYTNNSRLPFSIFGKLIDESNLYLYLGRSLRKESSDVEERIIASWKNGELEYFAEQYVELTGKNPPVVNVISLTTGINADNLFPIFDLLNHSEKYHLPDVIDSNDSLKTVELLSSVIKSRGKFPIFTEAEFNNIASNFIIPDYLVTKIRSKYFPQAYDEIIKLKEQGISRQHLIESDNKFIIPQYIISKIQSENFLEGYTAIKNVERVALTKKQIRDLESEYIIPLKITSQFKTEKYANAYRELQNLLSQNLLIKQSTGTRDDLSNTGTNISNSNSTTEKHERGINPPGSKNDSTPPTTGTILKPVLIVGIIIVCLILGVVIFGGGNAMQYANVIENQNNLGVVPSITPSNIVIASSNLELIGNIYGISDSEDTLDSLQFTIQNSGATPLDLTQLKVSYSDSATSWPDLAFIPRFDNYGRYNYNIKIDSFPQWTAYGNTDTNRGKNTLNQGDTAEFYVGVPRTCTPNTQFQITLKPQGSNGLIIKRTVPSDLNRKNILY